MQNFGGYMLETEAALWSLGEHFRYTRDLDWVMAIRPGPRIRRRLHPAQPACPTGVET